MVHCSFIKSGDFFELICVSTKLYELQHNPSDKRIGTVFLKYNQLQKALTYMEHMLKEWWKTKSHTNALCQSSLLGKTYMYLCYLIGLIGVDSLPVTRDRQGKIITNKPEKVGLYSTHSATIFISSPKFTWSQLQSGESALLAVASRWLHLFVS